MSSVLTSHSSCNGSLQTGWPLVWKTWKYEGICQLPGNWPKVREVSRKKSWPVRC